MPRCGRRPGHGPGPGQPSATGSAVPPTSPATTSTHQPAGPVRQYRSRRSRCPTPARNRPQHEPPDRSHQRPGRYGFGRCCTRSASPRPGARPRADCGRPRGQGVRRGGGRRSSRHRVLPGRAGFDVAGSGLVDAASVAQGVGGRGCARSTTLSIFKDLAVGGLVELVVQRPHVIGMLGGRSTAGVVEGMGPAEPAQLLTEGSVVVRLGWLVALGGAVLADNPAGQPYQRLR
jgi:hypothetical protein